MGHQSTVISKIKEKEMQQKKTYQSPNDTLFGLMRRWTCGVVAVSCRRPATSPGGGGDRGDGGGGRSGDAGGASSRHH